MGAYSEGQRVKATKILHQDGGSAYVGDKGKIIKSTGDGYHIRWDNGALHDTPIKDNEIERA